MVDSAVSYSTKSGPARTAVRIRMCPTAWPAFGAIWMMSPGRRSAGFVIRVPCWRPIAWLLMLVIPESIGVIAGSPAAWSAASAAVSASYTKPEQSTPSPIRCMNARRVSAVGGHVAFSRPRSTAACIAAWSCSAVPLPTLTAVGRPLNQGRTPAPSSACVPLAAPPSPELRLM